MTPDEIHPGGANIGTLTITGNLTQTSTATLTTQLSGTAPGTGFDQLTVNGAATIAGALNLSLFGLYNPAYLTPHVILTAGSRTGRFASIGGVFITPLKSLAVT